MMRREKVHFVPQWIWLSTWSRTTANAVLLPFRTCFFLFYFVLWCFIFRISHILHISLLLSFVFGFVDLAMCFVKKKKRKKKNWYYSLQPCIIIVLSVYCALLLLITQQQMIEPDQNLSPSCCFLSFCLHLLFFLSFL